MKIVGGKLMKKIWLLKVEENMKKNKIMQTRILFCFVTSAIIFFYIFHFIGAANASLYAGPGSPYYLEWLLMPLIYGNPYTPQDYVPPYSGYGYQQSYNPYSYQQSYYPYGYQQQPYSYGWGQPSYGWDAYNYMYPSNYNPYSYTMNQPSYGWNQPRGGVYDYVYNYPYPLNYNGYQYVPASTGGVYRINPSGQISYNGPTGYVEIGPYLN